MADPVARRRLGASPVEVVPLGVGCWAWGDEEYWRYGLDHDAGDVVAAWDACLGAGLDFFDTAEAYAWGKGEQILGALLRRSGAAVKIATKYAPLAGRGGAAAIAKGIAGSLRRLRLPAIDLYQLHWADRQEAPIAAVMNAFADAVEAGQVRAVGVSNFRAAEMREAHAALARRGVPLAVNQVKYSLVHRSPEVDGVLEACRELDVTLLAYSPLEQGLLTGKYSLGNRPAGERARVPWFADANLAAAQPLIARLQATGAAHGAQPAAVALAWLLAQDVVPLAGARSAEQARRNGEALHLRLTAAEVAELDEATQRWRVAV